MSYFMPHGCCMRWDPWLLTLHTISDFLIAMAYFSIPAALVTFVRRRRDLNFGFLFWLFSLFIFSCGVTHLFEIYVLWFPQYWWEGWAKVFTACASLATAVVLWRVIPEAVRLPTREQLAKANADLAVQELKRAEAERDSRLKDDFLATLSHELRTPLNAILGWTQLLEIGTFSEEKTREAIAVIGRNARVQSRLISDLLDLSAITAGKVRITTTEVNVRDVVESAVNTLMPMAISRQITITSRFEDEPCLVAGDPERLQQVIWSLLNNSLKFTQEGGSVDISVKPDASNIAIAVTDTGAGIAPEFLPSVFERFSQSDGTVTRSTGGLGIGLALARELVQLHKGSIRAESEGVGKGSIFLVKLPKSDGKAPESAPAVTGFDAPSLAGKYLLVVDDDADSRAITEETLRNVGAEVVGVDSAREALRQMSARRPDAVVSDIAMPGEDGYWLVRRIRELPDCGADQLPALALSAMARDSDRREALKAGFQIHLAKPIDRPGLLRAIAGLFQKKPAG